MTKTNNPTAIEHIRDMVQLSKTLADSEGLEMLSYLLKMAEEEIVEQRTKIDRKKVAG